MRKQRRRLRGLAAAVPVALLAAACGGDGGGDTRTAVDVNADRCPVDALESASGPVRIEFWHAMTAENETTLQELVAAYNDSQDKVEVEPIFQGQYKELADKFLASVRGDNLPAVIQLEETQIQLAIDSRAMLPAQTCVDAADYDLSDHLQPVVDQFTVEDVLWPMPFNVSSPVLYYNSLAFEAAGLTEDDVPSTLEEVQQVSRRLVESGVVEHGLALELQPWYVEQWLSMANEPVADNENGRADRATSVSIDTETGRGIYRWLDRMAESDLAMNVGRNEQGLDHFIAVANNEAGMTIGTSGALGSVLTALEGGAFPNVGVGVAPLPGGDEGGVQVGGAALWLVERGTDAEKAAAWDFVSWLNEPEQQAVWHAGTGYTPVRRSAITLPEVTALWEQTPEYRIAYDQMLASEAELGGPVVGDYTALREAIVTSLERLLLDDVAPDDALAGAEEEANAAIESYNERVGG